MAKAKIEGKVKRIDLPPVMTVEDSDKLEGTMLDQNSYKQLITTSCDVYDKETGNCLVKFRKNVLPAALLQQAYSPLVAAATPTDDRGVATGKNADGKAKTQRLLKNGKLDKVTRAKKVVNSGIIGYFERSVRFPHCRLTAYNKHNLGQFKQLYPMIKFVDNYYSKLMPAHYKRQRDLADRTSQDFVIPNTAFTTVSVNKNWQTAVHKDAGDYRDGFGNLVVVRKGTFEGGYFVLPRWAVAFDMRNMDVMLVDVHQWHGNTPIIMVDKNAVRLSLVMYYRENMIHCGTMAEELKRVQQRKRGEKLI